MAGKTLSIMAQDNWILFDAGLFIGALLDGDSRHEEAFVAVEAARKGDILACTTTSILSEVYAALTWVKAMPPHSPADAASAVRSLIDPPSQIQILSDDANVSLVMLHLAEKHNLTARRVHDARHAATALVHGVSDVYTYDVSDWKVFETDGVSIVGPATVGFSKA